MKQMKMMASVMCVLLMVPVVAFSANLANVTQVGDSDMATVDQVGAGNNANVSQYGGGLKADVDQVGSGNAATVSQGTSGAPVNSSALVGYVSGAKISQTGDNNQASTTWHVGNLGSQIMQDGDSNVATQDLSGTSGYKAGKYAIDIQQTGNFNQAAQVTSAKYGTYGIQEMLVKQDGDLNAATQTSISGISDGMEIIQTGNSNVSMQYQDGMHDKANATMVGNGNVTSQNQVYTVWGLTDRTVSIDIVGDNNIAMQSQFGVSSTADISIAGNNNAAMQNQIGNNNFAKLTQTGNSNFASQHQVGDGNSSTVVQTGNFNSAMVMQHN